jgi:hypothetical protein
VNIIKKLFGRAPENQKKLQTVRIFHATETLRADQIFNAFCQKKSEVEPRQVRRGREFAERFAQMTSWYDVPRAARRRLARRSLKSKAAKTAA